MIEPPRDRTGFEPPWLEDHEIIRLVGLLNLEIEVAVGTYWDIYAPDKTVGSTSFRRLRKKLMEPNPNRIGSDYHTWFQDWVKWENLDSTARIIYRHCVAAFFVRPGDLITFEGRLHQTATCTVKDYQTR